MATYIFFCAIIILVCISASRLSDRIGVPSLLLFILLGMLMGSDGIFRVSFSDYEFAEQVCSVTLIFIMFYGGFGTNWKAAKPVAVPSFILASLGVFLTAGVVGVFCHYILGFTWLESLLIGAVISSTDAASVFSILRSKNLNLKNGLASLLEIESGSNDPAAYMLTVICLGYMLGDQKPVLLMVAAQVAFGIIVGAGCAWIAMRLLRKADLKNGLDTILIVGIALLAYSGAVVIDGNGYLSVYVAGIILGNGHIRNKAALVHFFDGVTGLMQFLLFFLLGLLVFPSQIPRILGPSIAIALFLTFVGRPATIFALLAPFRFGIRDKLLVSWAGLRGAASIVFAIMVTVSDVPVRTDIFHIVFCVALLSVLFQGTLLPVLSRKLDLVDEEGSVLKTFNDYVDDAEMELTQLVIDENYPWKGKRISEIVLPPDSLIVMIQRGNEVVIPRGNTKIKQGDKIILNSQRYVDDSEIHLTEQVVEKDHPWVGKELREIDMTKKLLVVMIKRDGSSIIPRGDTVIMENDVLVLPAQ